MRHALVWTLVLGCTGEPQKTDADLVNNAEAPVNANLECPETTTLESGSSTKGVEHWCDKEGVMHGPYIRFYPNESKAVSGAYYSNQPDGSWIWWHENGQESRKGKYNRGKQTGSWTWWHENGNRQKEGDFLAGRKAGQWTSWFESGLKQEDGMYHNDMKNAVWNYYVDDEENSVARTELWQNGQMTEEKVVNDKKKKKR